MTGSDFERMPIWLADHWPLVAALALFNTLRIFGPDWYTAIIARRRRSRS